MALTCFKCKRLIAGHHKELFCHLRAVHQINQSETYFQCCEQGCGRTFSFMRSFRRHLLTHEGEQVLPGDPRGRQQGEARGRQQGENGPALEASGGAGSCEEGSGEEGSGGEGYWDDLDEEGISGRVALFLANLRARSNLTFSTLNFVVSRTTDLISDIVERLQSKTMALLNSLGHADSPEIDSLRQEFLSCATPFKGLETDYKQMEYFSNSGCFIQPLEEKLPGLSYVQERDTDSGSVRQLAISDTYQRIPLTPLLNMLLSLPGVLKAMLSWQQREGEGLEDFFDGEF